MKRQKLNRWQDGIFGPPREAGVYCVILYNDVTKKRRILYIGSSKNIAKRILTPTHPYIILHNHFSYPELVITKTRVCDNYLELEKSLIQRLKPEYNTVYKAKKLPSL